MDAQVITYLPTSLHIAPDASLIPTLRYYISNLPVTRTDPNPNLILTPTPLTDTLYLNLTHNRPNL